MNTIAPLDGLRQRLGLSAGADDARLLAALQAATAIGDDALQEQATGTVRPESFTHGTSAQRRRWFSRGFESGDPKACDTFAASDL